MKSLSLIALLAVACGTPDNNLEGRWKFTTGATTATCPGQQPYVQPLEGNSFVQILGADSVLHHADAVGCMYDFDVVGTKATLRKPPQTCSFYTPMGMSSVKQQEGTLESADGKTLTAKVKGIASLGFGDCDFGLEGTAQKMP